MSKLKAILLSLGLVFTLATTGFLTWANTPLAPMPEALAAMQSSSQVNEEDWFVFKPAGGEANTGLILYPGGRVDPRAYAPLASEIAQQGYLVVIVPMPLNLAVFAPDRAQEVISMFPEVQHWAIGGHSLGGAMAARFADQNPNTIQGLVLWAAYPASDNDLSEQNLAALSIIGSRDGLGTGQGVEASRSLLPMDTTYVLIDGGNHAQFGWYGEQPGDANATITRSDQQSQVIQATQALLAGLE
jgi:hypothetical protein